jgi:hypothetical protein
LKKSAGLIFDNNLTIRSLISLADCCIILKDFERAIKFYKLALQYTWFEDKRVKEIEIYDKLGNASKLKN